MKVSICIPTYNQAKFLERSIRSALNQTYEPFEIIVANDASTDETEILLNKLRIEITILKITNHPINIGITKNVNHCFQIATGDLIVRLDSDDMLLPHFIESFVPFFIENHNLGYGHASVQEIDQNDNPVRIRKLNRLNLFENSDSALKNAAFGYKVAANILIFRRSVLEVVGYIKTSINFCEDYYLVTSVSEHGFDNIYLNKILSKYRVWQDIGKIRSKRKLDEIKGLIAVFDEVLKPAYKKRNWSLIHPLRCMEKHAIRNADCLSWDIYTDQEKKDLLIELNKLSNTKKTKIIYWMYLNELGFLLLFKKWLTIKIKDGLKSIILKEH